MTDTEHQLYFTINLDAAQGAVLVTGFDGRESLSGLYAIDVDVAIARVDDAPAPDYGSWLYSSAALTVSDPAGQYRRDFHGLITAVTMQDQGRRHFHYRLTLEPALALLRHRRGYRIWHDSTVTEILHAMFDGLAPLRNRWRLDLHREPRKYEYRVQYDESDLDFAQRLMAEAGLFHFHLHRHDGHELVIADHVDAWRHDDVSVPYVAQRGPLQPGTRLIWSFRHRQAVQTQTVSLRDHDYLHPDQDLHGDAQSAEDRFGRLHADFYPGGFSDAGHGAALAGLRAGAMLRARQQADGAGDCYGFHAGLRFTLAGHPQQTMNRDWVICVLHHYGRQEQVLEEGASLRPVEYRNQFQCMPADRVFAQAPPPRPAIHGLQTAIVTGPEPGRVYSDALGRIKVIFPWGSDRDDGARTSLWVRVGQISAGGGWGAGFMPRVGQEVIVAFENGDPERPLVTGMVYNGNTRPGHFLPEHGTRSVIRSAFFRQGGKYSELSFEDGGDQPYLAQYSDGELRSRCIGDHLLQTDARWQQYVRQDLLLQVDGDCHLTLQGGSRQHIKGSQWSTVDGDRLRHCDGRAGETCGDDYTLQSEARIILDAKQSLTLSVGAAFVRLAADGITLSGPVVKINSGGEADKAEAVDMEAPLPPEQAVPTEDQPQGLLSLLQDLSSNPGPAARSLSQAGRENTPFVERCKP